MEIDIIDKDVINLVIARLESMPDNMKLAIGNRDFDKFQLIEHVKSRDLVGNTVIKMQLLYLRSLKKTGNKNTRTTSVIFTQP